LIVYQNDIEIICARVLQVATNCRLQYLALDLGWGRKIH